MALQPIYDDNGEVIDHFDDGLPEEQPAAPVKEAAQQREEIPPAQTETRREEPSEVVPQSWTIPDLFKETTDLFIGTTIHHDDGDPQGPLISLFARELPDGMVHVKTFRAEELSQRAFLDNLQKGIAATMQAHFLAWAERQRKKLEDEAKRKARTTQASAKSSSTGASVPTTSTASSTGASVPTPSQTSSSAQAQKATKSVPKEAAKKPEQKYATVSMFD